MSINVFDKALAGVFPSWGMQRIVAKQMIRAYEAARPSRLRRNRTDPGSGDAITGMAGESLRFQARHLDENHDLARGVLNVLVNHIIGRGISIEPQVKQEDGVLATELNRRLIELWEDWMRFPEVTWELHWNQMLRLIARCWLRDGEVLIKHVEGVNAKLDHGTQVPYSLELIEADYLPFEITETKNRIVHGVEKNGWGRPRAYHLYKTHPGDRHRLTQKSDIKKYPAHKIIHLKIADRIGQTRGVSIFASVLTRLEDIQDYELSERMAAKVAASMCGFIRKSPDAPLTQATPDLSGDRMMKMHPGMIFDNLLPGEDIGLIESHRPNAMLEPFRNSQMRAVASGTCTSFSSIAKNYNGTYSAQRQELVEQSVHYTALRDYFIERCVRPIWERFVAMALLSGRLNLDGVPTHQMSLNSAEFRGPSTPWIDPQKEITAEEKSVQAGFKSRAQVIRERGQNPIMVLDQIKQEKEQDQEAGLTFTTSPNGSGKTKTSNEPKEDQDDAKSDIDEKS